MRPAPRYARIVATLPWEARERYWTMARDYTDELGELTDAQREHLAESARDGKHPNREKMRALGAPPRPAA